VADDGRRWRPPGAPSDDFSDVELTNPTMSPLRRDAPRIATPLAPELQPTPARAGRNLATLTIAPFSEVSAHALLAHDNVIFTKSAYDALAEVCGA